MNSLKNYGIDVSKLELGQHDFHFQIDDKFFELFDYSLIDHGSLSASILLDKKTSFISLAFNIIGTIELICDRSLDSFDFDLETENEIVLKYGDEARELSDDVEMITFNTQLINVARYIYEFIGVVIPMKKLHPRYMNEPAEDQIIFSSNYDQEEISDIDPRWSELKKLKNKE
jgi:uncharacterized metal-binding protein YceD (DUF177 family)